MTENIIKAGIDPRAWAEAFEAMEPKIRRWAFLAAKMAEHGQTFSGMAKRHRTSTWYLAAAAHGKQAMTRRAVLAFETSLKVNLDPFLNPEEARKCKPKTAKWDKEEAL